MGVFELQQFSTFLKRGKFVLDRGTYGIGSATYGLWQNIEKAVVSREENAE
jgi:hypothetical protein